MLVSSYDWDPCGEDSEDSDVHAVYRGLPHRLAMGSAAGEDGHSATLSEQGNTSSDLSTEQEDTEQDRRTRGGQVNLRRLLRETIDQSAQAMKPMMVANLEFLHRSYINVY